VIYSPAELRRQSILLLAHARELREEAEAARRRAVERRLDSEQALASLKERREQAREIALRAGAVTSRFEAQALDLYGAGSHPLPKQR
jgi:hypothetical protein